MGLFKYCSRCKKEIIKYPNKYCDKCRAIVEEINKARLLALQKNDTYKKNRNKNRAMKNHDDKEQCFYASLSWRRLREYILSKYKGICIYCLFEYDKLTECKDVHHIVTLKEDWDKRLDVDNLVCLCRDCHLNIHHVYTQGEEAKKNLQKKLLMYVKQFKDKYNINLDYYDEDGLDDDSKEEEWRTKDD